jgi:hypothetical protein
VEAGGHVLQEPVAALQQRQVVGLGVQLGVSDLDAVAPVQLGERGVDLGRWRACSCSASASSSRAAAWSWEMSVSSSRTAGGLSG